MLANWLEIATILQHFTHNETQWPTAARRCHFALQDVSCRLSTPPQFSSQLKYFNAQHVHHDEDDVSKILWCSGNRSFEYLLQIIKGLLNFKLSSHWLIQLTTRDHNSTSVSTLHSCIAVCTPFPPWWRWWHGNHRDFVTFCQLPVFCAVGSHTRHTRLIQLTTKDHNSTSVCTLHSRIAARAPFPPWWRWWHGNHRDFVTFCQLPVFCAVGSRTRHTRTCLTQPRKENGPKMKRRDACLCCALLLRLIRLIGLNWSDKQTKIHWIVCISFSPAVALKCTLQ